MAKEHVFPLRLDGAVQTVSAAATWNGETSLVDIDTDGTYDFDLIDADLPGTILTIERSASGSSSVTVNDPNGDAIVDLDSATDTICLIYTGSEWQTLANATASGTLSTTALTMTGNLSVGGTATVTGAATLADAVKLDVTSTAQVSELSSRATGVTLNQVAGLVATNATSLADDTAATLTVTNSVCTANSVVIVVPSTNFNDLGGSSIEVTPGAGSFTIEYKNVSGGAVTTAQVFRFVVLNLV